MARHPTMTTADGRWSVEVITTRAGQHYRVKRLDTVMPAGPGWTSTGKLCTSITQVRELLGESFATLQEQRAQRFDGGR